MGKGPRCIKVAEAAAGPDGETDLLFQTRTRCCFLRRKETASQEPGVESRVSPKASRAQHSASNLQGCSLKRSFLESTLQP